MARMVNLLVFAIPLVAAARTGSLVLYHVQVAKANPEPPSEFMLVF